MSCRGVVRSLPVSLLLLVLVSAAWPVPAAPSADAAQVDVSNYDFTPSSVTIQSGDQVTWRWVGGTHSVETADGANQWCSTRSSGTCDRVFTTPGTYDYRCGVHPSSMQATITVEGTAPTISIDSPADGATVPETFTSDGTASHPEGITAVAWRIDGAAYSPVDDLQMNGPDASWSTFIDTNGLAAGIHTLTLRATAGDGATGTSSISFSIAAPDETDITVDSMGATDGNRRARLSAVVHNAGIRDVTGATLAFDYLYHGTWREIGRMTIDLPAGTTKARGITWESEGKVGSFEVRAVLDPDDVVAERDESNNSKQGSAAFVHRLLPGTDPFEPL